MGTWGIGPFEDDDAADWVYELETASDLTTVRAALTFVIDHDGYLENHVGSVAIAAATIVDCFTRSTVEDLPNLVRAWVERVKPTVTPADVAMARSALERVLGPESELRESFEESGSAAWLWNTKTLWGRLGGAQPSRPTVPGEPVESTKDSWTLASATHGGKPMMIRVNVAYRDSTDRSAYPIRIGVAIPLNQPHERRWPTGPENQQLQSVEAGLDRLLAGRAVLVAAITGDNVREFVFHARDSEWIAAFHREAMATVVTHEVQVMAEHDPDWTVFHDLLPG